MASKRAPEILSLEPAQTPDHLTWISDGHPPGSIVEAWSTRLDPGDSLACESSGDTLSIRFNGKLTPVPLQDDRTTHDVRDTSNDRIEAPPASLLETRVMPTMPTPDATSTTTAPPALRQSSSMRFWTSVALLYPAWDLSAPVTFPLIAGEALTADSYVYGLFCVLLAATAVLAWVPHRVALAIAFLAAAPALMLSQALPLVSLVAGLILLFVLGARLPARAEREKQGSE